jgi:hypothetical protein
VSLIYDYYFIEGLISALNTTEPDANGSKTVVGVASFGMSG